MNRKQLAQLIIQKLEDNRESLAKEFAMSDQISSCVIDNLLDEQIVHFIYEAFPQKEEMSQRNSIREFKYVAAQMNLYNPLLEEIIYAFQDPKFLSLLSEITGIPQLLPDEYLYAGGISLMDRGCFLNPHIDNSHDKDRKNYRVLNLLYYVTPDWQEGYGGNLELW
ncbi:MAG: 2OG-Fe(II) oxygenase, partial [Microcystis panniformis]